LTYCEHARQTIVQHPVRPSQLDDTKSFAFTHKAAGTINELVEPSFDKLRARPERAEGMIG
jgi:hypothetical protein